MDHASEYLDFARELERENARLVAQAQTPNNPEQLYRKPDPVSHLSFENAFLKRRNSYLSAQNAAQFAQITDLLGVLAEITEASAKSDTDHTNLRDQISRYVTGMEIRSRVSTPPSQ